MKVATMVRGYMPVPRPPDIPYAPVDVAVHIATGLRRRGHDVVFYAPVGSAPDVPVKTLGVTPFITNRAEWVDYLGNIKPHLHYVSWLRDFTLAREMFEGARRGDHDVLLFHHPEIALPFVRDYPDVPVASVLHDPLYDWYADMLATHRSPASFVVSVSDSQRKGRTDLPFRATVHNGVDLQKFAFHEAPPDAPLLFAGRVTPEKGVAEAVQAALAADRELVLCGTVFPRDQEYFDEHVKPYLGERIHYAGYVEREHLAPYYQRAGALLMPISWDEPFGLTMIEAMACGTPVIATARGAVPEVVAHGRTGFVVENPQQFASAIRDVSRIRRRDCRARAEDHFSIERMVGRYEDLCLGLPLREQP